MFSLARSVLIDRAFSEVAVDIGSINESRAPRDKRALRYFLSVLCVPLRVLCGRCVKRPVQAVQDYSRLSRWSLMRARTASSRVAVSAISHISTAFRQNSCFWYSVASAVIAS